MEEETLTGGLANAGEVVRVGGTVRRPVGAHTAAVHQLLGHLERVGFRGAPRVLGVDEQGREVLEWVPGTTYRKGPAFQSPVIGDAELASLGRLIGDFHHAMRSFVPSADVRFEGHEPVGFEGAFIAHRDLCLENVVFRDGAAVALIDFDFAGRADPIWDVAVAARHFVPLADPRDVAGDGLRVEEAAARISVLAEAYGLAEGQLPRLVAAAEHYLERGYRGFKARVDAGSPAHVQLWAEGFGDRAVRACAWLRVNAERLAAGAVR